MSTCAALSCSVKRQNSRELWAEISCSDWDFPSDSKKCMFWGKQNPRLPKAERSLKSVLKLALIMNICKGDRYE